MAINLSSLTAYVDEQRLPLIRKASLGATTAKHFTLQTEVKGETALNLLDTTVEFGDGSTCGWDPTGSADFTQRKIVPAPIKINMSFCEKKMLKYWMNHEVRVAAGQSTLPFEQEIMDSIVDKINEKVDAWIWNGGRIAGVDYKGILGLLTEASVNDLGKGATIYESTMKVYNAIPSETLGTSSIYMGIDMFRLLAQELVAKDMYHYDFNVNDPSFELVLPGTNTKVYGVPGLNKTNKIVGLNDEHTFVGVDMSGDEEKFDFWYSKDNQEFRLAVYFNLGQQFAYPNECAIVNHTME